MHLFTYGSLVFPAVMEALTGRHFESCTAHLHGYRRRMLRSRIYPGLRPSPAERTPGRLYLRLDALALACLDDFEGHEYERRTVVVDVGDAMLAAQTYVLTPARRALLGETLWDPDRFAALHLAAYRECCRRFRRAWLARFLGRHG